MYKAYKLKIFGNKGKIQALDELIQFYRDEVNRKIRLFWHFNRVDRAYQPKEYCKGGRIISDASKRAWSIVKSAKKRGHKEEPFFIAEEIDLNEFSGRIIPELQTKEYDLWLSVISLEPRKRLKLPCKKHQKFNEALEQGELRKSFKLKKIRGKYYVLFYVDLPEKRSKNNKVLGLDVGLNHTVATSDGKFLGDELRDLRIRTKWRHYRKGLSAFKQGLNKIAKEIIERYKGCDFAMEKLLFKGKKKRSKTFRRNKKNWSYAYLSHKLEEWGRLEGFRLLRSNAAFSSQKCPECGEVDKANRKNECFECVSCHYMEHADTVGAINLAKDVAQDHTCLRSITIGGDRNVSPSRSSGGSSRSCT